MCDDIPDEIRIILDSFRLLQHDVPTNLLTRGWAITDLDIGDDEPLEFFWPPTAPLTYGKRPDEYGHGVLGRAKLPSQCTPWIAPTRISRADTGWLVTYGEAVAQHPDEPTHYADDAALIADLERIEWWPMGVDDAHQVQRERLYAVTVAEANDAPYLGFIITEPYRSRINALMEHVRFDAMQQHGIGTVEKPARSRPRGDLSAQMRLIDAAAWASAVRTARAGGDGWDTSGSKPFFSSE